jgi:hypothetical protein
MEGSSGRARRVASIAAVAVVVAVLIGGGLMLVAGRAPTRITIAAGAPGGAYHAFAQRLQEAVARRGFELTLLETNGSVDNVAAISEGRADIGLVQSGTEELTDTSGFTAISELFYEPIWIWYRPDAMDAMTGIEDLSGHSVAIGVPGSGTHAVAKRLLALNGVATISPVEASATETAELLSAGEIDAGFIVAAADAPVIEGLAMDPALAVHRYGHAEAYARQLPYLSAIPIARGVLDIARDVPPEDGRMLAARATLVGEPGIHPDVARLLVTVIPEVLAYPLVGDPAAFPSLGMTRFAVNDDARRYLEEGPTPLESVLPFWIASPLARYYVIILPLLVLVYPAWQIVKATYGWYMKSRITGWYPRLHAIERGLPESTLPQLRLQKRFLVAVVDQVSSRTRVSAGYMSAYYDLRGHIEWVTAKVDARIVELSAADQAEAGGLPGADDVSTAPADPRAFSDVEMGIDDDLRAMRLAGQATRADRDV